MRTAVGEHTLAGKRHVSQPVAWPERQVAGVFLWVPVTSGPLAKMTMESLHFSCSSAMVLLFLYACWPPPAVDP